jgi:hypothetical protein
MDTVQWRARVKMTMYLPVACKAGRFLTSETCLCFLKTLIHGAGLVFNTVLTYSLLQAYTFFANLKLKMSRYCHIGAKGERHSSYSFLNSVLDGGEWSASRPGRVLPRERTPGTHWIGGWVGLRAGLDTGQIKPFASTGDRTPVVQSVVRHHTD